MENWKKPKLKDFEIDSEGNVLKFDSNLSLRPVNVSLTLTPQHLTEIMRCSSSPVYFIENYCKIIHPDEGLIPFKIRDYQLGFLKNIHDNRFSCNMMPRQSGKTISVAAYLTWYSLFNSNKTIGVLAHKKDIAKEILLKVQRMYQNLPKWIQQGVKQFAKTSIELENGSRIIAESTSGTAAAGHAFNMLYLDEFALVQDHVASDFMASVFPTISASKESKIIITSTPRGLNHFYDLYHNEEYSSYTVPWNSIPGRDDAFKAAEIKRIGILRFRQEYQTEFLGSSNTLISGEILQDLKKVQPIEFKFDENLRIFKKSNPRCAYICAADPSQGLGSDDSAFVVLDVTAYPFEVVASFNDPNTSTPLFANILKEIGELYNQAMMVIELNGPGLDVIQRLYEELAYDNILGWNLKDRIRAKEKGIRTTNAIKIQGCQRLKDLIENKKLFVQDSKIIKQLYHFIQEGKSWKGEGTQKDDLVMACTLAAFFISLPEFRDFVGNPEEFVKAVLEAHLGKINSDMAELFKHENGLPHFVTDDRDWMNTNPDFIPIELSKSYELKVQKKLSSIKSRKFLDAWSWDEK